MLLLLLLLCIITVFVTHVLLPQLFFVYGIYDFVIYNIYFLINGKLFKFINFGIAPKMHCTIPIYSSITEFKSIWSKRSVQQGMVALFFSAFVPSLLPTMGVRKYLSLHHCITWCWYVSFQTLNFKIVCFCVTNKKL